VSVVVCGRVITGAAYPSIVTTMELLDAAGVRIAEISTDVEGRVLSVNTFPVITQAGSLEQAVEHIVAAYRTHLHHR
jgi:hypothetical protein